MELRALGNTGLRVAPLCLGGNVFGWTADEATTFRVLDRAADAGLNFIDTGDNYSQWVPGHCGGESESILGRWFTRSGKRERIILATKVEKLAGLGTPSLSGAYISRAVDASLKRLHTDYIDLYQAHADDCATPLAETLEAFAEVLRSGKARAIGASNYDAPRLAEALRLSRECGLPRYETLQPEYNLLERQEYEENLEDLSVKEHLGVITYFSLASGFLTGKYRSEADLHLSQRGRVVKKYLNARGLRILATLDGVAAEYGSTPASISLAWLTARPSVTAPIVSVTTPDQLDDLIKACHLRLGHAAVQRMNEASAPEGVSVRPL
jgi:aryl-alcohol dehydrogenase-like predicted oxidoreductase